MRFLQRYKQYENKNITKLTDNDGHWYWIPNEMVNNFNEYLDKMRGKEYLDIPNIFDDFIDKYSKYETGGDENLTPQYFGKDVYQNLMLQVYNDDEYNDITSKIWEDIQEEGFVDDLEDYYDEKYNKDDFEYIMLKISDTDKQGLINFDEEIVEKFADFDFELKKEQEPDYPTMVDFIDYDNGMVYIIRLI
jgi:hypothetical protein